jgi:hypothetical protein
MVQRARERAGFDVVGTQTDQFVTDNEATHMVDLAAVALYDKLVSARGEEYYAKEQKISVVPYTTPGTNIYQLADDFYQGLGCYVFSGSLSAFVPIDSYMQREVPTLRTQALLGYWDASQTRYRFTGTQAVAFTVPPGPVLPENAPIAQVELFPEPKFAFDLYVRYIPTCIRPPITGDPDDPSVVTDTYYDGINGWEDWVIWTVAMWMAQKEERDITPFQSQLGMLEQRILDLAGARSVGDPERVVDVKGAIRLAARRRNGGVRTIWGWWTS